VRHASAAARPLDNGARGVIIRPVSGPSGALGIRPRRQTKYALRYVNSARQTRLMLSPKKADIILLDMFKLHLFPLNMPAYRVACFANGNDVDTAIVNGEILMEGRRVRTVDEAEQPELAQKESDLAMQRTGLAHLLAIPDRPPADPFCEFRRDDIEQSIPARFEEQVARRPEAVAVLTRDACLTYDAVNSGANRLAHAILASAGDREGPVALLLDQGIEAVIAVIGSLKAGKFYVPLDPRRPEPRLAALLDDAGARVIPTADRHAATAARLRRGARVVMTAGDIRPGVSRENPALPLAGPSPLPRCTLRCSGSTAPGRFPDGSWSSFRRTRPGRIRSTRASTGRALRGTASTLNCSTQIGLSCSRSRMPGGLPRGSSGTCGTGEGRHEQAPLRTLPA